MGNAQTYEDEGYTAICYPLTV